MAADPSQELPDDVPPGCVEVDGVAWCVEHSGVVDELADYVDESGEPACNMRDPGAEPCRPVPLFVRVEGETFTTRRGATAAIWQATNAGRELHARLVHARALAASS